MEAELESSKPIALIGFMGSGKTQAGRLLAAALGLEFLDLDSRIEAATGASIGALFAGLGESGFRQIELASLREAAELPGPFVLSCGGGAVTLEAARQVLRERFRTVWLDVPAGELELRLEGARADRPLLAGDGWRDRIRELLGRREPWYREAAAVRHHWRRGEGPEETARLIQDELRGL